MNDGEMIFCRTPALGKALVGAGPARDGAVRGQGPLLRFKETAA